eukprot:jgi/Mesvir1/19825/Mv13115-RA.1
MAELASFDCIVMERMVAKLAKDYNLVTENKDGKLVAKTVRDALRTHYKENESLDDVMYSFCLRLITMAIETRSLVGSLESVLEEIKRVIGNPSLLVQRSEFPPTLAWMHTEWMNKVEEIAHLVATGVSVAEFRDIQTELREDEHVSLAYHHFTRLCADIVREVFYDCLTGGPNEHDRVRSVSASWFELVTWSGAHKQGLQVVPRITVLKTGEQLSTERKVYLQRSSVKSSRRLLPDIPPDLVTDDESSEGSIEF